MSSPDLFATREDLEALRRLSRAQTEAVRAGDLDTLERVTTARQDLLDSLRGRRIPAGQVDDIAAAGREATTLMAAWVRGVETALAELRRGRRALGGYHARLATPPGFLDQIR